MGRNVRNAAVAAKIEVTYGVDPTPTAAANAMLIGSVDNTPIVANNVNRDRLRGYLGGSEQLLGTRYSQLGFNAELAGAGAAGTVPKWAVLLLACAFGETITAGERVTYKPVTDPQPSATMYAWDSGVLHKLVGARAGGTLKLVSGELPTLDIKATGIYSAPTATAVPTPSFTGFVTPLIPTDDNTLDLVIGGTLSAAGTAVAITGGTAYPSMGVEVDIGNQVEFTALIGGSSIDVVDRDSSGKVRLDLTAAQEVALAADVAAGTTRSLGIVHGTTAGNRLAIFLPNVQFINYAKDEINGRRLVSFDLRVLPLAGNDEITLVVF